MAIEFIAWVDDFLFPDTQVLPVVYNLEAYNGNKHIYIISSDGYRYKVELNTPRYGLWYLSGERWRQFCNCHLNDHVQVLHFIEEGNDCFYVTTYNNNGKEVASYEGFKSSFSRFKTVVYPDPRLPQSIPAELLLGLDVLDEISIQVNGVSFPFHVRRITGSEEGGSDVYQLLGDAWNTMVEGVGLEAGTMYVLTKNRGNRLWLDAFNDNGCMITEVLFKGSATLRKQQLQLDNHEKLDDRMTNICYWPFQMDHFGQGYRSFYKKYAHIQSQNRLAIPSKFLVVHPMHTYSKTMIVHQEYRDEMIIRIESHKENPDMTNHVNIHGQWRVLADICGFEYSKMIRFKYVGNGEDLDAPEGENPIFPIFHIC